MARPQRKQVALVLREISDHLRGNLHGVLDFVQKHVSWDVYTEGALPRLPWERIAEWEGDGLIVAIDTKSELDRVIEKNVPTVNVSSRLRDLPVPSVVSDNEAIGEIAARHLLDQGLKNFAFAGPMDLEHNRQRLAGFSRTVEAAGGSTDVLKLKYVRRRLANDKQSIVDVQSLGKQLLSLNYPVGILAPHDDIGCWLLKACREHQLDVPSQVAVVGVDNFELLCGFSSPQLSSVAQSSFRIGFEAANMLDQLMNGTKLDSELLLVPPFGVIARQSTDILAVNDEEVAEALRYIRSHDAETSVADVLEHVSVSRRSMEIRFKNAMGHSIEQELINARISHAKHLLTETSMPITQVALSSGYQSSTGFSAAFKKETGRSPREYRKQVTAPARNSRSPN